jgi:FixJ family two-component response regulator
VERRPAVYVVDDESLVRESLTLLLRTEGFEVSAHPSAEDFLGQYRPRAAPACLVLDVRLCGMSGLGLQQELATRHVTIPVIIVTGFGKISMAVQAMRAGAADFLEKPFDRETLLSTIERSLDRDAQNCRNQASANSWAERIDLLSPREKEVMELLIVAKSTKQIATILAIDPKTVSKYRARLLEKLQVENIVEVARNWSPAGLN